MRELFWELPDDACDPRKAVTVVVVRPEKKDKRWVALGAAAVAVAVAGGVLAASAGRAPKMTESGTRVGAAPSTSTLERATAMLSMTPEPSAARARSTVREDDPYEDAPSKRGSTPRVEPVPSAGAATSSTSTTSSAATVAPTATTFFTPRY